MAAVAPSRLAALTRLRCSIFQTAYNPQSIRTGAKYLRARLRGPSMINYYPEVLSIKDMGRMEGLTVKDETGKKLGKIYDRDELLRVESIRLRTLRGKTTPKKAQSKDESRRQKRRR